MANYNSALQDNNTDLQAILDAINALPEAGGTAGGTAGSDDYRKIETVVNIDAAVSVTAEDYVA